MARGGFAAVAALALAGCASLPPGAVGHGAIRIDHMVMPAADVAGTDVAAYAGFDNRGGDDRLLGIDCACAASVELHKVVRDGPDLVPPLRTWSGTRPFGTFDFGQVLQPARQFLCYTAGRTETVGQSSDHFKGEILFVRHCSAPSFRQK